MAWALVGISPSTVACSLASPIESVRAPGTGLQGETLKFGDVVDSPDFVLHYFCTIFSSITTGCKMNGRVPYAYVCGRRYRIQLGSSEDLAAAGTSPEGDPRRPRSHPLG